MGRSSTNGGSPLPSLITRYYKNTKKMGVGWFWHGSFFSNPTAEFTATFPFSTKSGFFR
jgi:hypothetical protein